MQESVKEEQDNKILAADLGIPSNNAVDEIADN